jgi:hypothetical protein
MSDTPTPALIRAVRAGCEARIEIGCMWPDCACDTFPQAIRAAIAAFAETSIDDYRSMIDGLREDFTRLLEFWPPSKRGSRCQAILDQMQMRLDVGKDND